MKKNFTYLLQLNRLDKASSCIHRFCVAFCHSQNSAWGSKGFQERQCHNDLLPDQKSIWSNLRNSDSWSKKEEKLRLSCVNSKFLNHILLKEKPSAQDRWLLWLHLINFEVPLEESIFCTKRIKCLCWDYGYIQSTPNMFGFHSFLFKNVIAFNGKYDEEEAEKSVNAPAGECYCFLHWSSHCADLPMKVHRDSFLFSTSFISPSPPLFISFFPSSSEGLDDLSLTTSDCRMMENLMGRTSFQLLARGSTCVDPDPFLSVRAPENGTT